MCIHIPAVGGTVLFAADPDVGTSTIYLNQLAWSPPEPPQGIILHYIQHQDHQSHHQPGDCPTGGGGDRHLL